MDWHQQAPGTPGRPDLPALVSQRARDGDMLASKAEQIWLGAYGSAAGDLALQTLSTGGLWVGVWAVVTWSWGILQPVLGRIGAI